MQHEECRLPDEEEEDSVKAVELTSGFVGPVTLIQFPSFICFVN